MTKASARNDLSIRTRTTTKTMVSTISRKPSLISGGAGLSPGPVERAVGGAGGARGVAVGRRDLSARRRGGGAGRDAVVGRRLRRTLRAGRRGAVGLRGMLLTAPRRGGGRLGGVERPSVLFCHATPSSLL